MSAYHALVLNNVCRSNHHRIAVMALEHLEAGNQEGWRDFFLKYHTTFLEGSKAPDEEFHDFKNHVCHPEDNFWGGAPQAAREWYKRTVRALAEQDWEHAAWNAGVMSHYLVDPCQPFHTGQSESEAVIHRAAEYSFSKAFPELKLIIEQHTGWPKLKTPGGDDWVEQMVRDAATNSHQYYHTMIDHYHLEAGRKKPELALDQELKDIVARQLAYATVMFARVMDRAIAESKAQAPKVSLAVSALLGTMKTPLHVLMRKLDHQEDRKVVKQQFEEFRRTGKVKHTLGDDDKLVRALHAQEVSGKHISSVDAEWPREHATAHGTGAEARVHKKIKKSKIKPKDEGRAEGEAQAAMVEEIKAETKPAAPAEPRIRLTRDASVVDAPSIGPKTAGKLNVIGVKTVGDLLALTPEDAAHRIKAGHINARIIKDWQAQALLACSLPEISGTSAQMLVGAGIDSIEDLAEAEPDFVVDAITQFVKTSDGERATRGAPVPERERVKAWIEAAADIRQSRSAA